MFSKRFSILILMGITIFLVGSYALLFTSPVLAQCGGGHPVAGSTCLACHKDLASINAKGEWHSIHAGQDLCLNCHGGNGTALDKTLAHNDMAANPLDNIYTDCHSCHPNDYIIRANRFANELGDTVGSCSTPTTVSASPVNYQPVVIETTSMTAPGTSLLPWILGGTVVIFMGAILVGFILRRL